MSVRQTLSQFDWWHEVVLLVLLVLLLAMAQILIPGFASWKDQLFFSRQLWELALLTLPMTMIIVTGGIDLSVGSTMGLCAIAFGLTWQSTGRFEIATLACLVTGLAAGFLNGYLISRFQLHALIVTLATFSAYRGIAEGISQGNAYSRFGLAFSQLARGSWLGIPWPGYLFGLLALACGVWLGMTPSGRSLYAIGYNEKASLFSGVPVDRIRVGLYTFSGFLAGLAAVIYVSRFDSAKADAGKGFELDTITAVVVGGTSIFGGRGNLVGTILGLLLIHEIRLFVGRYWGIDELKSIVIGVMLILSIMISRGFSPNDR